MLAGASCRPFSDRNPPPQCSQGSKTILTLVKHFYFTPPVGLPCVQDWVGPEKRASLLRTQADTGAAEEIQDMHCLSLKLRSWLFAAHGQWAERPCDAGTSHFCPAFSCDPVDSSHNLWKVLWSNDCCWEAFKGKRRPVSPLACSFAIHGCGVQPPGVAHMSTLQANPAHIQVTAVDS